MTNAMIRREDLPAHLQEQFGVEEAKHYIVPPRLKVVQPMSNKLKEMGFDEGDVVAVPVNISVAPVLQVEKNGKTRPGDEGKPFHIVPLFFFAEYCLWNPLETKGTLDMIRERSFDKQSEVAVKARDPKLRQMVCPEMPEKDGKPLYCRYVEHLNFIVLLYEPGHALEGVGLNLSFSRGEHSQGRQPLTLLDLRRAPLCGVRFMCQVKKRNKNDNEWFGIDVNNPADVDPFVTDPEEFAVYKKMHLELKEAHAAQLLRADYSDGEDESAAADSAF